MGPSGTNLRLCTIWGGLTGLGPGTPAGLVYLGLQAAS
jgi:hypothetical protein